MHIGKAIKTFSHAQAWCLEQRKRVYIKGRGGHMDCHSFAVVRSMSFGGLQNMMDSGRLFEAHK